jgi:arginine/lysine/ornithine decarboxylase
MIARRNMNEQMEDVAPLQPKIDFDAWWALVENKIPTHHNREVIKADFRGRGLSSQETMQAYNEALGKYGLKLS